MKKKKVNIPTFNDWKEEAEKKKKNTNLNLWEQSEETELNLSPEAKKELTKKTSGLYLRIDPLTLNELKLIARDKGLAVTSLARMLIKERVQDISQATRSS